MSTARFLIGDSLTVLRSLPNHCVQSVITSPPYLAKRSYLPDDHPDKPLELGQEPTPGEFLANLLAITDELWRVVRDDGTIWFNLGDSAAFSGGSGGDYLPGGLREGQAVYEGTAKRAVRWARNKADWPLAKSVCWVPQLFGASLAYGRNLLTGEPCQQWVTRPPVTWCKPNPPVGEIIDKFREATELIVWAAKNSRPGGYYFDLDAVRIKTGREGLPSSGTFRRQSYPGGSGDANGDGRKTSPDNPLGAPPLDWWEIATRPYSGAHFATFPPELIRLPVIVSCPPGGTILDPFAGSGTTLAVATGHGRDAIGVDLDTRNADLAAARVGMFLTVEHHAPAEAPA